MQWFSGEVNRVDECEMSVRVILTVLSSGSSYSMHCITSIPCVVTFDRTALREVNGTNDTDMFLSSKLRKLHKDKVRG